jgi:hypothetical protein
MMEIVKVEPADTDSAFDDEEEQDAPGSQDDAATTNSADLCSNGPGHRQVGENLRQQREEGVVLSFLWDLLIRMEPHQGQGSCTWRNLCQDLQQYPTKVGVDLLTGGLRQGTHLDHCGG